MGMFAHLYPDNKCPRVLNLKVIDEHMPWPMDRKALAITMPTINALHMHPKRIPNASQMQCIPNASQMHPKGIPNEILQEPCQLTNCKNHARKYWKPGIILALQESCHIVGMELARGGTSFPPLPPLYYIPGGALNDGVFFSALLLLAVTSCTIELPGGICYTDSWPAKTLMYIFTYLALTGAF